jgi:hypothetical protein
VQLKELGKLKKLNYLIGTQTLDLPACSKVPQPTMLPRIRIIIIIIIIISKKDAPRKLLYISCFAWMMLVCKGETRMLYRKNTELQIY